MAAASDDHPGFPDTPGLRHAVARLTAAMDQESVRRTLLRDEHRRDAVNGVIGEAMRRMTPERRDALASAFPELEPSLTLLGK